MSRTGGPVLIRGLRGWQWVQTPLSCGATWEQPPPALPRHRAMALLLLAAILALLCPPMVRASWAAPEGSGCLRQGILGPGGGIPLTLRFGWSAG